MGNYLTVQGDMWDVISFRVYKTEYLMHLIVDANPKYRNIVVFPANCELDIPDVSESNNVDFPPWRRRG